LDEILDKISEEHINERDRILNGDVDDVDTDHTDTDAPKSSEKTEI
jgi:hypothetical protein